MSDLIIIRDWELRISGLKVNIVFSFNMDWSIDDLSFYKLKGDNLILLTLMHDGLSDVIQFNISSLDKNKKRMLISKLSANNLNFIISLDTQIENEKFLQIPLI